MAVFIDFDGPLYGLNGVALIFGCMICNLFLFTYSMIQPMSPTMKAPLLAEPDDKIYKAKLSILIIATKGHNILAQV